MSFYVSCEESEPENDLDNSITDPVFPVAKIQKISNRGLVTIIWNVKMLVPSNFRSLGRKADRNLSYN